MGDVVTFPGARAPAQDARQKEAQGLRRLINMGKAKLPAAESKQVATTLDAAIERFAEREGRGGITRLCGEIWPSEKGANPARRRGQLREIKMPRKLLFYAERIAAAAGEPKDDLLLEAFRGTRLDAAVNQNALGLDQEAELEEFWTSLSGTLHALAAAIARSEKLKDHTERMVALQGAYDLAADVIRPTTSGRLLDRPLANWNNHWSEFPPVPSVVLFSEPKSVSMPRELTIRETGSVIPVQMTVLREVRLAIGPADSVLVPAPLFEFRSVLQITGPDGPMRIRVPWLYLDENEVEVECNGAWQSADVPFADAENNCFVRPYDQSAGFGADWGLLSSLYRLEESARARFPARLEAPLQFEHAYIVWRPVTADTCRNLLLRPLNGADEDGLPPAALGSFQAAPDGQRPETFCPPGTIAEAIELALHVQGPAGLPMRLRAEAARMAALVRGWHAERAVAAEVTHRNLRASWEEWT